MKLFLALAIIGFFQFAANIADVTETNLPQNLTRNSMDVVAVDIDNDEDNDLVVACEFCPNIILVNDGTGKFTNESKQRLPQVVHDSEDIAAEDFDKDGDVDLIFVSEDDFVNEYYLNDGKGYFTDASERLPVKGKSNAVCAADVDKDGDKDIVVGNEGQDFLLLNDGKGSFTEVTATHFPKDTDVAQDIKTLDADKDGDADLVFGNEDAGKIYLNNGKGKFTNATGALPEIAGTVETRKVQVKDIDKDGDEDLFFCNVAFRPGRSKRNLVLLNNGKGTFTDATEQWYKGANNFHSLDAQFVDVNNDGMDDLVVSNGFGGRLQYFINKKTTFEEVEEQNLPAFPNMDVICLLSFNADRSKAKSLYLGVFRGQDRLLRISE